MKLKFRPHHFLCAVGFQGKGYSKSFIKNFTAIVKQLRGPEGGATIIEVTQYTDSVCSPCPHKQGKLCETQDKITRLDTAHGKALNLKHGEHITWAQAKQRIIENITTEKFNQICDSCNWKPLGICENALMELKDKK